MELSDFKDKHVGERIFLVGSGPSLAYTNLDLIKDETSFAMNNIALIYPYTEWRPTYYWNTSSLSTWLQHWIDCANLAIRFGQPSFLRDKHPYDDAPNIVSVRHRAAWLYDAETGERAKCYYPAWSTGVEKIVFHYLGSAYSLLQVVIYMGFEEVILLGIDNRYDTDGPVHFLPEYDGTQVYTQKFRKTEKGRQRKSWVAARYHTARHGLKIYDATVDGELDVFPKVVLEDIL